MVIGLLDQLRIKAVSGRTARALNRSGATRAVALDVSKAFDRVWPADISYKLKCYGISGQIFGLISSFLSNRRLRVVLDGKFSQEYPVNSEISLLILVLQFSYYTLMTFLTVLSVILLSMLMICSKLDQASDL